MSYGLCPKCLRPGVRRERRPNGNDECLLGHVYPSATAIKQTSDKKQLRTAVCRALMDGQTVKDVAQLIGQSDNYIVRLLNDKL
jgi:hypothetical protein